MQSMFLHYDCLLIIFSASYIQWDGPLYGGSSYTLLVGGKGNGQDSAPGKIYNVYARNLIGDGETLILVESQ